MHPNVKRLLKELKKSPQTVEELSKTLGGSPNDILIWAKLAESEGFLDIKTYKSNRVVYTEEGKQYLKSGLPETQLLNAIIDETTISSLKSHPMFSKGFGVLRKMGAIKIEGERVIKIPGVNTEEKEAIFRSFLIQPQQKVVFSGGVGTLKDRELYLSVPIDLSYDYETPYHW